MSEPDMPQILKRLLESDQHSTSFTDTWTQGRSAFGGLSTAMAVCGAGKMLSEPQPLRSLMVSFIGPVVPGEVSVVPHTQRKGRNVTQIAVDLFSADDLCLQIMAVFGNARDTLSVEPDPGFNAEPRDARYSFDNKRTGPPFLRFFDGFWTGGGVPFSGSRENRLGLWARHRSDMSEFPNEKLVALADIPPPVILSHYDKPIVPASSLTWSLEFVIEPEQVDSDWFYLDFMIEHAAHGYTQQSGKLFTEDGRLCALSRQCMVYFDHRIRELR